MADDNMFYCSFVSIHYIICECGETFPSEEALKNHLELEHPHKSDKKVKESTEKAQSREVCIAPHQIVQIKMENPEVENTVNLENGTMKLENGTVKLENGTLKLQKKFVKLDNNTIKLQDNVKPSKLVKFDVTSVKEKKPKPAYHNIRNIVCEVCGKRYASNAALRYHQRVHTGERPYQCTFCPKSFTMPLFQQIHLRTHTGERPYQCPYCPKAFSNKAALLRHNRVHTGVKPYECPKCGKTFTQSNSMKLHIHTVHLKMPAPYKSKRRRAESKAREANVKIELDEITVVKPEVDLYQEEVQEGEVFYGIDMTGREEEVTYEVVYEQE